MSDQFTFQPGDEIRYIFGMNALDSFEVEVVHDDGGPQVEIAMGAGDYGAGERTLRRMVKRADIAWSKDGPVEKRYRAWQQATLLKAREG